MAKKIEDNDAMSNGISATLVASLQALATTYGVELRGSYVKTGGAQNGEGKAASFYFKP